jgi:signal transduction histidine kinase
VFRRIRIRSKLAAALAVPLAALVVMASLEVVRASAQASDVRDQAELATASLGPGSLVIRLQDERNRAALDLIGMGDATDLAVETNEEARELTDEAIVELHAELDARSDETAAVFAPALAAMEDLEGLRAAIDAFDGPMDFGNTDFANEVFSRYTVVTEAFFDATTRIAATVDDPSLRTGVHLIDRSNRQSEMRARLVRQVILMVLTGEAESREGLREVAALHDRSEGYDADIAAATTGRYAGLADEVFADPQVQSFNEQIRTFLATGEVDVFGLLDSVRTAPDRGYTGLRNATSELLQGEAGRLVDDAEARQRLIAGLTALVVLLALGVTWLASRSITRPLRSLTEQAEEMAGERLPAAVQQILDTPAGEDVAIPEVAPVEVKTRDEVREVAAALTTVQQSALDLAFEQAVLRRNIADSFVNLGRRNQNLLNRQLDFITELERDETDPDTLEGLFKLDHLATRMRRNAESLLVLAGVEPPRQWSAPVAAADVVRAALGEVEDYQRVSVRHLEPASITGAVAADLAHVLAELIENALSFSPPEEQVEIKGRLTRDGYTVAITDNGLGMSELELNRANRRLAGAESFTVAPSRYLGHYVAGHLASRMGVCIELAAGPAGGTTARVDVPMALVADEEAPVALAGPAPAHGQEPAASEPEPGILPEADIWAAIAPLAATDPGAPAPSPDLGPTSSTAPSASLDPDTTGSGLPRRRSSTDALGGDRSSDDRGQDEAAAEPLAATTRWSDAPLSAEDGGSELWADVGRDLLDSPAPVPASFPPPPPPPPAPASRVEAIGFGGLVAGGDGSSLPRRTPGAHRPDQVAGPDGTPRGAMTAGEPLPSTPEDVYAFLSSFQSGVERGLADAHRSPEEDDQ